MLECKKSSEFIRIHSLTQAPVVKANEQNSACGIYVIMPAIITASQLFFFPFLNEASDSLKDFFISFSLHHKMPHLRQSPEVYPRTSIHMPVAVVSGAENRASGRVLCGVYLIYSLIYPSFCGNNSPCGWQNAEVVMSQCFMTTPLRIHHTCVMSAYTSLDRPLESSARDVYLAGCLIQQRRRDAVWNCWIGNEENQVWRR